MSVQKYLHLFFVFALLIPLAVDAQSLSTRTGGIADVETSLYLYPSNAYLVMKLSYLRSANFPNQEILTLPLSFSITDVDSDDFDTLAYSERNLSKSKNFII